MPTDFDGLIIFIAGFLAWLACAGLFWGVEKRSGSDLDNSIKVPLTTVVLALMSALAYYVLYLTEAKPFSGGAFMLLLGAIAAVSQGFFQYTKNVFKLTTGMQSREAKDDAVLDAVASSDPLVASKAAAIVVPLDDSGQPKP